MRGYAMLCGVVLNGMGWRRLVPDCWDDTWLCIVVYRGVEVVRGDMGWCVIALVDAQCGAG